MPKLLTNDAQLAWESATKSLEKKHANDFAIVSLPDPISEDPFEVALDAETLTKRTIQGSFVTAVVQGGKIAIQFASQLVLARLLFPDDFGLLAMVGPLLGFVQLVTDIGLGQAIIQRSTLAHAQVSALFWINISLSFGMAIVFMAISPLVAMTFGEPRILNLMMALSALIPLSALAIHPFALLSRQMRFGLIAKYDLISTVAGTVIAAAFAWLGCSYWSLVAGQLVTTAVNCSFGWSSCAWRPSRPALHHDNWTYLKFSGNLTGANLATYITTSADNIIVGLTTGATSLGFYDRSYRLVVQPLNQMIAPISRVALPILSRLNDRPEEYRTTYIHILKALLLISVPAMLVCISNGHLIVGTFLGERWLAAAPIFSWICVGGLTSALYSSFYWLFISQGRTHDLMQTTLVNSVINIISFLVGAIWGIVGIALFGAIAFVLVTTPIMLFRATRSGPVSYKDVLRCVLPCIVCGVVTYGLLELAGGVLVSGALIKLFLLTSLAYGGFAALTLLMPGGWSYFQDLKRIKALVQGG